MSPDVEEVVRRELDADLGRGDDSPRVDRAVLTGLEHEQTTTVRRRQVVTVVAAAAAVALVVGMLGATGAAVAPSRLPSRTGRPGTGWSTSEGVR